MSYDSEHDSHHTLKPINMSFRHPPHPPQFFPPRPPFAATSEVATTFWHENVTDNHQAKSVPYPESTLLKKPRIIEDNPSESFPTHVSNPAMPPPNPPSPRGVGKIFRKTRICSKFIEGTCPFGYNCNFAHGTQDLRKPPPNWRELVTSYGDDRLGNWDEDQKIIYRMKLCTRFSNGQECPYGEKCNYLHENPAKFRDREVSVISITGNPVDNSSGSEDPVVSGTTGPNFDSSQLNQKPYWKTKMCNKWESGHCPYGDNCHYAHGITELHKFGGHSEVETATTGTAPSRLLPSSTNDVSQSDMGIGDSNQQMLSKKQLILAKKLGKINRIYGDWIDDLPPMRSTPNEEN